MVKMRNCLFIIFVGWHSLACFDHSVCVSAASHRSRKQWTEKAHKIYLLLYSHLFSRIPSASSRKNSRKTKGVYCVTTKLPIQWALFYSFQWPELSLQHQFHIIFYGLEDFFIILTLHCCLVNEYEICEKKIECVLTFRWKVEKSKKFPVSFHSSSELIQKKKKKKEKTLNGNGVSVKLSSWPGC